MNDNLSNVIKEVSSAPLRSSIITSAALIDTALKKLIENYLIEKSKSLELFSFSGCLGSFSAKIKMAYALGLISNELYNDIDSYRKIRNKCAHNITIDETILQSITDIAKNFKLLEATFDINDSMSIQHYTAIEFAVILIALTKRINSVEHCEEYPFEAHDDYLKFDENDYELLSHLSE